ncbi:MAG: hypothetical protein J7L69_00420 [Desulfobulbaceae bacterium]|nr:hypothetical protein [Desulfobulbaceae bacterium]
MEVTHFKTESTQMIEVEIYETGEKTLIFAKKLIANQKNILNSSIIITAAEYASYKVSMVEKTRPFDLACCNGDFSRSGVSC